ncbi:unnamed protein product, partial [Urochloa humidicola]
APCAAYLAGAPRVLSARRVRCARGPSRGSAGVPLAAGGAHLMRRDDEVARKPEDMRTGPASRRRRDCLMSCARAGGGPRRSWGRRFTCGELMPRVAAEA